MKAQVTDQFFNRELSLLEFNRRVLAQAEDTDIPLLERLKYLAIASSNLDEFFEVRVACLHERRDCKGLAIGPDGLDAAQTLSLVRLQVHQLIKRQYKLLNQQVLPGLAEQGIHFLRRRDWTAQQHDWLHRFFVQQIMPVLTPIALDPAHPFPRVMNKRLNFIVELKGRNAFGRRASKAIVHAPRVLPRPLALPAEVAEGKHDFVMLASIMRAFVGDLFAGMEVISCHQFRVTRNSALEVDEDEDTDLRELLQGGLYKRHYGDAIRLEVSEQCPQALADWLLQQCRLSRDDLYRVDGPVNLARLMDIPSMLERDDLKFATFTPGLPVALCDAGVNIFEAISQGDILLHHPFQAFDPVVALVKQAANDTQVVAIKQTVYRTGVDSELMNALMQAIANGKEVTVVVELMARFDEQANIGWANRLEAMGGHVVYGVVGYKVHAKMLMVVRKEKHRIRRYVHLGTGNYHPRTARLYTDYGLLTVDAGMGNDVNKVFSQLTSLGKPGKLQHLWQSPFSLHRNILQAIAREQQVAQQGKPARIIAKMNSLLEPQVIKALYQASQAGVKIELIVRGVCALRPGVKGLSENIRVRSIIGRFLEHTRIFYFLNQGAEDVYLSSADWMGRNFFQRVEVCFPLRDKRIKQQVIHEGLRLYLEDNQQAWLLRQDGQYRCRHSRGRARAAQSILLQGLAG